MALSETTANRYNLRRAASFAAAGINSSDVAYAHPGFSGYGDGTCCLCGKQHIKWLFNLRFDAPSVIDALVGVGKGIYRGEALVLEPVGSECIQSWFDALPESQEKLEALARWTYELSKLNEAKREKAIESVLTKAGFTVVTLTERFEAARMSSGARQLPRHKRRVLDEFARRLTRSKTLRGSLRSVKAAQFALSLLAEAEAVVVAPPPPPAPVAAPAALVSFCGVTGDEDDAEPTAAAVEPKLPKTADEQLLDDATAVVADPARFGQLNTYEQGALVDITEKVARYGAFASLRQRGFLVNLVQRANKSAVKASEETEAKSLATATAQPGDATFASPSGIAGARY